MTFSSTITAAVITASASIIALVVNIIVSDKQKRRAKMIEIMLARCDDQISKFYAPLSNLVDQLDATDDLKNQMVASDEVHKKEIEAITYKKYFLPIHRKIADIFECNLHLVEGLHMPLSFIDYHKHVASEKVFFSLVDNIEEAKREKTIPEGANATCKPIPYPEPNFQKDISSGLDKVLERQERLIKLLDKELAGLVSTPLNISTHDGSPPLFYRRVAGSEPEISD